MPDFVVDLYLTLDGDLAEASVAVIAHSRNDAAAVAMILAADHEWGPDKIAPTKVDWVAVENGVEDGFDEDFRHLNHLVSIEKRRALLEGWLRGH